jgi:hypothetical protein
MLGAAIAAFTRSGVKGTWRSRRPVASKMAFAIAPAVTVTAVSPAPAAGMSGRLRSTISIAGTSALRNSGLYVRQSTEVIFWPSQVTSSRSAPADSLNRPALELIAQPVRVRESVRNHSR